MNRAQRRATRCHHEVTVNIPVRVDVAQVGPTKWAWTLFLTLRGGEREMGKGFGNSAAAADAAAIAYGQRLDLHPDEIAIAAPAAPPGPRKHCH